jgi:hypothetical protein
MSHAGISIAGGGAYGRQQSQQYADDDDGGMQPNVSSPFYRCMYDIERIERAHQLPDIGQTRLPSTGGCCSTSKSKAFSL